MTDVSADLAGVLRAAANDLRAGAGATDVVTVCDRLGLGLEVSERSQQGSHRGELLDVGGAHIIRIFGRITDAAELSPNQRFVIAHEIAHYVLHSAGSSAPRRPSEYWAEERLCDDFARWLLIEPAPSVRPACATGRQVLDFLTEVCRTYRVPEKLAAKHMAITLELPVVIGRVERNEQSSTQRLGWLSWQYGTREGWHRQNEQRRAIYERDVLATALKAAQINGRGSRLKASLDGLVDPWLEVLTERSAIFVGLNEKQRTEVSGAEELPFGT